MSNETRNPVAFVEATVRFPLYEGDVQDSNWEWFEYREPGITASGELGVCSRLVEVIKASVKPITAPEEA